MDSVCDLLASRARGPALSRVEGSGASFYLPGGPADQPPPSSQQPVQGPEAQPLSLGARIEGGLQAAYIHGAAAAESWHTLWSGPDALLTELTRQKIALASIQAPRDPGNYNKQEFAAYATAQQRLSTLLQTIYQAASAGLDKTIACMAMMNDVLGWALLYVKEDPKRANEGAEVLAAVQKIAADVDLNYAGFRAVQDLAFQNLAAKVQQYEAFRMGVWGGADALRDFLYQLGIQAQRLVDALKENLPAAAAAGLLGGLGLVALGLAALAAVSAFKR